MRMSDFVVREAIVPELTATTKEGVIREMVESLRAAGYFKSGEPEDIVKAILKRELLGSTGIGRGVAIPHTKHNSVDRLIGTVAVSSTGVPFDSVDGEPVYRPGPAGVAPGPARRPPARLENVARSMRDDGFVRSLRQATSRDAIWAIARRGPLAITVLAMRRFCGQPLPRPLAGRARERHQKVLVTP